MINKLTYQVLRHRAIVVVLLGVFLLAGAIAFRELPIEAYPDVTNVSVQIITLFPGHAAEEVERMVTIPIESVMNGIPKRVSMRSISLFGLSQITLVFEDDAKNDVIRNLANQAPGHRHPPAGRPGRSVPRRHPHRRGLPLHLAGFPGFPPRRSALWKTGSSRRNFAPSPASSTSTPSAA